MALAGARRKFLLQGKFFLRDFPFWAGFQVLRLAVEVRTICRRAHRCARKALKGSAPKYMYPGNSKGGHHLGTCGEQGLPHTVGVPEAIFSPPESQRQQDFVGSEEHEVGWSCQSTRIRASLALPGPASLRRQLCFSDSPSAVHRCASKGVRGPDLHPA